LYAFLYAFLYILSSTVIGFGCRGIVGVMLNWNFGVFSNGGDQQCRFQGKSIGSGCIWGHNGHHGGQAITSMALLHEPW